MYFNFTGHPKGCPFSCIYFQIVFFLIHFWGKISKNLKNAGAAPWHQRLERAIITMTKCSKLNSSMDLSAFKGYENNAR